MAKKKAASSKDAPNFEEAIANIENIVDKLESGELDLTDSLKQYEIGVKQLRQCHQTLEQAEQKVTLLSGFDADGNPVTEPMPDTQFRGTATESRNTEAPPRRKGGTEPLASGSSEDDVDDSAGLF